MNGNDQYGCCAPAGAGHQTMLNTAIGGHPAIVTTENTLADYGAITGFSPDDPASDQGTDPHELFKYWQTTGMVDSAGNRHKILAYLFSDPTNYDQFLEAIYLFGSVGLAIAVPQSAMDQFNAGQPWHVVPGWHWQGRQIIGYHYVPAVADRATPVVITWGKTQGLTVDFFRKYVQMVAVPLSTEILTSGISLEGFNISQLQSDLNDLQQQPA
jgi:hypothetical protein